MNLLELSAAIHDKLRRGKTIPTDELRQIVGSLAEPLANIAKALDKGRLPAAPARQLALRLATLCNSIGIAERSVTTATEADAEFAQQLDQAAREKRLLMSPTGRGILHETEAGRELLRQQRFAKR